MSKRYNSMQVAVMRAKIRTKCIGASTQELEIIVKECQRVIDKRRNKK